MSREENRIMLQCPVSLICYVQILTQGTMTQEGIEHLIKVLELTKDAYPKQAKLDAEQAKRAEAETQYLQSEVHP